QRGDFSSDFAFASDAAVTALVGPSGHGKTSILLAIAGLVRPVAGHISVGGLTLFDSTAGIDVPARDRNLGMMFQDVRLFPHLRVRANLGYAGRATPADVTAMAAQLGLSKLIDRWPRHLSGGEARRVALGRALLARPAALLLDEPLAHLDPARAGEMIGLLAAASLEVPLLYVTHDLGEAGRLGASIVEI
ncbi:MAG: ATP-binding cassette domain-containing protein, partial [Sandarakinorhabdus sp.]|nr:ATP-binding cassette domain-containing protein [Sandarakinorhabdus sp.]